MLVKKVGFQTGRVSILVLVDAALRQLLLTFRTHPSSYVSILVLVDAALRPFTFILRQIEINVSILVLVDAALRQGSVL